MNEKLRTEVKLLKAFQGVSYKELSELLEMRTDSFYNWLCGYYNLGETRQKRLLSILADLKEF